MIIKAKDIDASRLRIIVFDILHATSSLDLISINQLRRDCEAGLNLKSNSLDGPIVKELLTDILAEYQSAFLGVRTETLGGEFKANKFSKAEIEFIMRIVNEYVEKGEIARGDICSSTRLEGYKLESRNDMWQELCILIPHRKKHSLQQLVQRELMKESREGNGWSDGDKETLTKLVQEKGNDWTSIGKAMGRLNDDCKNMFQRFAERKVRGPFSPKEDLELVAAIRTALKLDLDFPAVQMTDKGIPWKLVAAELDNKRQPLDYLRRWPIVKRKAILIEAQANKDTGPSDDSSSSSSSGSGSRSGSSSSGSSSSTDSSGNTGNSADSSSSSSNSSSSSSSSSGSAGVYEQPRHGIIAMPTSECISGPNRAFALRWLECIQKCGASDESQVIWADVDREMLLPHSYSGKRWRAVTSRLNAGFNFTEKLSNLRRVFSDILSEDKYQENIKNRKEKTEKVSNNVRKNSWSEAPLSLSDEDDADPLIRKMPKKREKRAKVKTPLKAPKIVQVKPPKEKKTPKAKPVPTRAVVSKATESEMPLRNILKSLLQREVTAGAARSDSDTGSDDEEEEGEGEGDGGRHTQSSQSKRRARRPKAATKKEKAIKSKAVKTIKSKAMKGCRGGRGGRNIPSNSDSDSGSDGDDNDDVDKNVFDESGDDNADEAEEEAEDERADEEEEEDEEEELQMQHRREEEDRRREEEEREERRREEEEEEEEEDVDDDESVGGGGDSDIGDLRVEYEEEGRGEENEEEEEVEDEAEEQEEDKEGVEDEEKGREEGEEEGREEDRSYRDDFSISDDDEAEDAEVGDRGVEEDDGDEEEDEGEEVDEGSRNDYGGAGGGDDETDEQSGDEGGEEVEDVVEDGVEGEIAGGVVGGDTDDGDYSSGGVDMDIDGEEVREKVEARWVEEMGEERGEDNEANEEEVHFEGGEYHEPLEEHTATVVTGSDYTSPREKPIHQEILIKSEPSDEADIDGEEYPIEEGNQGGDYGVSRRSSRSEYEVEEKRKRKQERQETRERKRVRAEMRASRSP